MWRGADQVAAAAAQRYALPCLAIIGLAGDRGISVDDVVALLWPDAESKAAQGEFEALLAALPGWLGGVQPVQLSPEGLRLDPAVISCDVRDFEFAAASGAPDQATRLFEGPFLQGVPAPGRSFERWRDREAARIAQIAKWCHDASRPRRSKVQLTPGAQIGHGGRYRIEREIGGGAAATVYLAHDSRHDRPVAIKVLREEISETISPERFEKEIKFVAQLQHPHILPLFDSGELGPVLYSVMPFVDGETLRDRIKREGKLRLEDAIRIAAEVADALSYAHERGVVHRDVKPENILLSDGHALLTDFGIARSVDATNAARTTLPGVVLGTAPYMSPEQATGEADLDGRTDVYSIGAVLYEMLSGAPPFAGEPSRRIMTRRLTEVPPRVSKMGVSLPESVDEALNRALQPAPQDRANARQFADALAAAERHLTGELRARPTGARRDRRQIAIATVIALALGVVLFATKCAGVLSSASIVPDSALLQRMLVAEDARGLNGVAPLIDGLKSSDPATRRVAIRAIGRLQRPDLSQVLAGSLNDPLAVLRAEGANALAQSVSGPQREASAVAGSRAAVREVLRLLTSRPTPEPDAAVTGVIARALGRLPLVDSAAARQVESWIGGAVAGRSGGALSGLPVSAAHDVAEGLYALARARRTVGDPSPRAIALLQAAAHYDTDGHVRTIGLLGLTAAGALDSGTVQRATLDADPQVRRLALAGLGSLAINARTAAVRRALVDTSGMVRVDAIRAARSLASPPDCASIVTATRDANPHVLLAAIDALALPCADGQARTQALQGIAGSLALADVPRSAGRASWHAAAHAIVALARTDGPATVRLLPRFVAHPRAQVREYAARAAALIKDDTTLLLLASDPNHNVQDAAIAGLSQVRKHDGDSVYVASLGSQGYQVVMAASAALAGSSDAAAAPALLGALDRLSSERRENSRDARVAVLARLAELGHPADASRLEQYLADFDTTIAAKASELVTKWTGRRATARPMPLPLVGEPLAQVFTSKGLQLRVTMDKSSGGGTWVVRLFSDETPATVARIARLARAHYYDGLTFHRIVPNFVIQGGSPDATEYVGDDTFMRDEVGLRSHNRGTLGISTRGRDTGDAQLFVNLVDNPRLDHDYTVFGEVISGMAVVDGILEGDTIARVEVINSRGE